MAEFLERFRIFGPSERPQILPQEIEELVLRTPEKQPAEVNWLTSLPRIPGEMIQFDEHIFQLGLKPPTSSPVQDFCSQHLEIGI